MQQKICKSFEDLKNNLNETEPTFKVSSPKKETITLSEKQKELYEEALFGIKKYSSADLYKMKEKRKSYIHKKAVKTQMVLNEFKQKVMIAYSDYILKKTCPESIISLFQKNTQESNSYICTLTFKDLNINKKDVIDLLIKKEILPIDFYSL
jgi:hypothetical protein